MARRRYHRRRSGARFWFDALWLWALIAAVTWTAMPRVNAIWLQLTRTPEERARLEASAYYANCSEARAAGAAPIYPGQPGYRPEMDGDDDGIACEPYR